jgi:hypothetical protein
MGRRGPHHHDLTRPRRDAPQLGPRTATIPAAPSLSRDPTARIRAARVTADVATDAA